MTLGAAYYIETEGAERDPYNWVPEVVAAGARVRRARRAPVARPRRAWSTSSSATARSPVRWRTRLAAGRGVTILNEVVLNQVLVRFDGTGDDRDGTPAMRGPGPSSTPSSATGRAGWAARPGRAARRCASRSRGWQTTPTTSSVRPTPSWPARTRSTAARRRAKTPVAGWTNGVFEVGAASGGGAVGPAATVDQVAALWSTSRCGGTP